MKIKIAIFVLITIERVEKMKVTVTKGPHFERNLEKCFDYLFKRFLEELEVEKNQELLNGLEGKDND